MNLTIRMNILESFSPVQFRKKFIDLHSKFSLGQQDSIEFIRIFLDDISRETSKSFSEYKELNLDEDSKDKLSMKYIIIIIRVEKIQ